MLKKQLQREPSPLQAVAIVAFEARRGWRLKEFDPIGSPENESLPVMMTSALPVRAFFLALFLGATAGASSAQDDAEADNGTDPTRLSRNFSAGYEFVDLPGGGDVATLNFRYGTPISQDGQTALQFKLPITDSNVGTDPGFDLGDISIKLTRVLALTCGYGIVASAELSFDTADQPSGGSGTEVLKLTGVYAKFLKGGAIFVPAIVHTERLGDRVDGRADISNTVVDFY